MNGDVKAAGDVEGRKPKRATTVVDAAAYLMTEYERTYGEPLDERRLHGLLYLAQRESYALYDKPLFAEPLYARSDGPYSPEAHEVYRQALG